MLSLRLPGKYSMAHVVPLWVCAPKKCSLGTSGWSSILAGWIIWNNHIKCRMQSCLFHFKCLFHFAVQILLIMLLGLVVWNYLEGNTLIFMLKELLIFIEERDKNKHFYWACWCAVGCCVTCSCLPTSSFQHSSYLHSAASMKSDQRFMFETTPVVPE